VRIEFLKEWMKYKLGDTTEDVAGGVADVLFMRRIARPAPEAVSDPAPAVGAQNQTEKPATKIRRRN
jgi:hypothetical protein